MITDIEIEVMNELENLCTSKPLKEMVAIITDMLSNLDSETYYLMSDKNKQAFLKLYAEKLNQYMVQELSVDDYSKEVEEKPTETQPKKETSDFTYEDAKNDILTYLTGQEEDYFLLRNTSKQSILKNADIIEKLTNEHYRCVVRYCCDRTWSCEDACDSDPSFFQESKSLTDTLNAIGMGKKPFHSSRRHKNEAEKTVY